MDYGYQKVMELQRRCGISFEDADKALKAEKGDIDKASVYAMRRKKSAESRQQNASRFRNFITYRILITKNGKSTLDLSLGVLLLVLFFAWLLTAMTTNEPFVAIGVLLLFVFGLIVFTGNTIIIAPSEKKETKLKTVEQEEKSEDEVYVQNAEHEVETEDDGFTSIEVK